VLSERYDWTFGDHEARRDSLTYSGEVGPAVAGLTRVVDLWRAGIAAMSDDDIFTVGFSQATEIDQQAPFAHLVAHVNREIIHHGSEIHTLTDLYRVRGGTHV
jgi:DinB family protein